MLPEVFDFDEGKSKAIKPFAAPEAKIQECVDGCPVGAIKWRDE
jgi:ferredoxin